MIDACKVLSDLADEKKFNCNHEEAEMFKDLAYMLALNGTELDDAMTNFKQKYIGPGFHVGDECYYDNDPERTFVLTRMWFDQNGLGDDSYYFDAIYHDGETISDGTLYLVKKTGSQYALKLDLLGG